jgi:hypothetical protein
MLKGTPVIFFTTKTQMATGGMMTPIMMVISIMISNQMDRTRA